VRAKKLLAMAQTFLSTRRMRRRWNGFLDAHPDLLSGIEMIKGWLPPLNFITIHYSYFIIVSLATSVIFWSTSNPRASISYVDSLFMVVSAVTESGLNTINLSQMSSFQQVILWLLIIFGSTIWVSIWTLLARKHVFEQRFKAIVKAELEKKLRKRGSSKGSPILRKINSFRTAHADQTQDNAILPIGAHEHHIQDSRNGDGSSFPHMSAAAGDHIAFVDHSPPPPTRGRTSAYQHNTQPFKRGTYISPNEEEGDTGEKAFHWRFLRKENIGRNSQFHSLTTGERESLGGCEYRALKVLSWIVPIYWVAWQVLGCISVGAFVNHTKPEVATSNGVNPWWAGLFYAISAFNNSGMALVDANMLPWQQDNYILITMGLLILAGNTAFPIFLRLVLWSGLKILRLATSEESFCDLKETLEFILKYPRRVYTNLFPSRLTWWLLFMLVLLNSIDWVGFEVLNLGNPIIESIPPGSRAMDGLFQAFGK
jgi:hypothetical protein